MIKTEQLMNRGIVTPGKTPAGNPSFAGWTRHAHELVASEKYKTWEELLAKVRERYPTTLPFWVREVWEDYMRHKDAQEMHLRNMRRK